MEGSYSSIASPMHQGHFVEHQIGKDQMCLSMVTWDPLITSVNNLKTFFVTLFFCPRSSFFFFYFYFHSITHKEFIVCHCHCLR